MAQRVFTRLVEVLRRLMPGQPVHTVFDVGARDCEESRQFALAFPEARIYAFECNPATLPLCQAVAAAEPRITLTEKAVSERAGSISFFPIDQENTQTGVANGNPGASSLLRVTGNYPEEHYVQKEIVVDTIRLDAFMQEHSIPGIDILWMDVQGAEGRVLEGLGERLSDLRCLHMEIEFFEIYKGQSLFGDVDPWLRARGFRLLGLTSYSRYAADALYVRADIPVDNRALAREFPYLGRNLRKMRLHRVQRALRRMIGLPAWPERRKP